MGGTDRQWQGTTDQLCRRLGFTRGDAKGEKTDRAAQQKHVVSSKPLLLPVRVKPSDFYSIACVRRMRSSAYERAVKRGWTGYQRDRSS